MSKYIDLDYMAQRIVDKAYKIGGDTPLLYDRGEANVIVAEVLRCMNDLGYKIIQEIDFEFLNKTKE